MLNIKKWFNSFKNEPEPDVKPIRVANYMHSSTYGAPLAIREHVKMAADSALPWSGLASDHGGLVNNPFFNCTLLGHTADMGQWQGFSGFLGYPFLSLLQQNGIVKLCIDTIADEMTRNFIELSSTEGDYQNEIGLLYKAIDKHKIKQLCNQTARFNELFGGLMIFIDTGASDEELLNPLLISEYSSEIRRFRRFQIIEPLNLFPGVYETYDPTSQFYFKPLTWWVLGKRVHHTRLIHIKSCDLPVILKPPYNFMGVPHAQILWDYIMHFNKVRVASADILERYSRTIFKTDMETTMIADGGREELMKRLRLMSDTNNKGITAIDYDNEDIVQINTPLQGLHDLVWQGLQIISAINKTPSVKLLGESPRGLSKGDADMMNWYNHIHSKQEHDLGDAISTMLSILKIKYLGKLYPEITFDFVPLSEEDKELKARVNKTKVESGCLLLDRNVISRTEFRQEVIADEELGFNNLEPNLDLELTTEFPDEVPEVDIELYDRDRLDVD